MSFLSPIYPAPIILHPSPCIHHSASIIMHPSSRIHRPASIVQHLSSNILRTYSAPIHLLSFDNFSIYSRANVEINCKILYCISFILICYSFQILQLQMNNENYHYVFTSFVSKNHLNNCLQKSIFKHLRKLYAPDQFKIFYLKHVQNAYSLLYVKFQERHNILWQY